MLKWNMHDCFECKSKIQGESYPIDAVLLALPLNNLIYVLCDPKENKCKVINACTVVHIFLLCSRVLFGDEVFALFHIALPICFGRGSIRSLVTPIRSCHLI